MAVAGGQHSTASVAKQFRYDHRIGPADQLVVGKAMPQHRRAIRNARILYEEVKRQGFKGSYDAVCDCAAPWRAPPDESPNLARHSKQCSADQLYRLAMQRPDRCRPFQEQVVGAVSALGSASGRRN